MRKRDRRRKNSNIDDVQNDTENPVHNQNDHKQVHDQLYSTISHVYASIRSNIVLSDVRRKLSLPKNPLDRLRGKTKKSGIRETEADTRPSGFYDSIKSNSGNQTKYLPNGNIAVTDSDKGIVNKQDCCETNKYIHPVSSAVSKPPVSGKASTESSQYIHPITVNDLVLKQSTKEERITSADSPCLALSQDFENYLEPVQIKTPHMCKSTINEDPYTSMSHNRYDGKSEPELNDSYMSSRPRYVESIKTNISSNINDTGTTNTDKHDQRNKVSLMLEHNLLSERPASDQGYISMEGNNISKLPICIQPSGDYIPMDYSNQDQLYYNSQDKKERDFGYEEPTQSKSRYEKRDNEAETIVSEHDSATHPRKLFDMADVELETPVKNFLCTEESCETSKPKKAKLKRFKRNTENEVKGIDQTLQVEMLNSNEHTRSLTSALCQKRYVKDRTSPVDTDVKCRDLDNVHHDVTDGDNGYSRIISVIR